MIEADILLNDHHYVLYPWREPVDPCRLTIQLTIRNPEATDNQKYDEHGSLFEHGSF